MIDLESVLEPLIVSDLGDRPPVAALRQRSARRRRRRATVKWGAVGLAIVLVAGFAMLGRRSPASPVVTTPGTSPSAVGEPAMAPGWRIVDPGLAANLMPDSTVWTGTELVMFGRPVDRMARGSGATAVAYDVERGSWRDVAKAPFPAVPVLAWTGTEVMAVFDDPVDRAVRHAASWNPSTNRWRELPAPPATGIVLANGASLVWTGNYAIDTTTLSIYRPDTQTWVAGSHPPIEMAGHELTPLWDGQQLLWVPTTATAGWAYDPSSDAWTSLPPAPADGPPPFAGVSHTFRAVWTGTEVVRGDVAYNPRTRTWRTLPVMPLDDAERKTLDQGFGCIVQASSVASRAVYNTCVAIFALDDHDRWQRIATDSPAPGPTPQIDPAEMGSSGPPRSIEASSLIGAGSTLITWRRPVESYLSGHGYSTLNPGGSRALVNAFVPGPVTDVRESQQLPLTEARQ